MASAPEAVDSRGARFNEGVATVLLLLAFVINEPLVIPGLATVLLAGAVFGPRLGPFHVLYAQAIGPRRAPPAELEDPRAMRVADGIAALLLAVSTVAFVGEHINVAWSLALLTAIVTGLSASTPLSLRCGIYYALRQRISTRRSDDDRPRSPQPVPQRHHDFSQAVQAGSSWRARWTGLRTLKTWVTVVDQTSDGAWIVRAGSEQLILPPGDQHFWPVATCSRCKKVVTSVDVSRHQRRALCADCTVFSRETSLGPDRSGES